MILYLMIDSCQQTIINIKIFINNFLFLKTENYFLNLKTRPIIFFYIYIENVSLRIHYEKDGLCLRILMVFCF